MAFDSLFYGSVWVFQVIGILVVIMARLSSGGWKQVACERCVFGFVLLLGMATVTAIVMSSQHWLSLALSLCVVSILATIHVRPAAASV